MAVPSIATQKVRSAVETTTIPSGTVPDSPTPLQMILDLDRTEDSPAPSFETSPRRDSVRMSDPAPAPTATATPAPAPVPAYVPSEDLLKAAEHFNIAIIDDNGMPVDLNHVADLVEAEALRETAECYGIYTTNDEGVSLDPECVKALIQSVKDDRRAKNVEKLTALYNRPSPMMDEAKAGLEGETKEALENEVENKQDLAPEDEDELEVFYARVYRRADGRRRMRFDTFGYHALDADYDSDEDAEGEYPEQLMLALYAQDFAAADRIEAEIGAFLIKKEGVLTGRGTELMTAEAVAAGEVPDYLDLPLESDTSNKLRAKRVLNPARQRKRDNTTSRPAVADEMADIPRPDIPRRFIGDNVHGPTILQQLYSNTCPAVNVPRPTPRDLPMAGEDATRPDDPLDDYEDIIARHLLSSRAYC
ncbi:hypothetical protein BDW02DRAFT_572090 [Decorospora gaudefroyi]|uniref:Uncharacterized protein n=1 Tax=Decorospora gaudefroyi TaxID=184978 RepID=A0A6A5KA72_9PLEO|nr:hypothetical protein BDW02DRAFT_572090 [Decorospora gaudefroyi]